jgi:hypothetical protein
LLKVLLLVQCHAKCEKWVRDVLAGTSWVATRPVDRGACCFLLLLLNAHSLPGKTRSVAALFIKDPREGDCMQMRRRHFDDTWMVRGATVECPEVHGTTSLKSACAEQLLHAQERCSWNCTSLWQETDHLEPKIKRSSAALLFDNLAVPQATVLSSVLNPSYQAFSVFFLSFPFLFLLLFLRIPFSLVCVY